jgi:hypothetical protein
MKLTVTLILLVAFSSFTVVAAEDTVSGVQAVETLRLQLLEVESREAELQAKAKQLDEDLKPENIERALAGIGSTRPEELRETRRRQLTIERDGVRAQLKLLAQSRERLESVIRVAETRAYQQSAQGATPPLDQMLAAQTASSGWRLGMLTGLFALVGLVVVFVIARRARIPGK